MRLLSYLFFLLFLHVSSAQNADFQSIILNKGLTENANALVRLDETDIRLLSSDRMTVKSRTVTTVFRNAGKEAIKNYVYYDSEIKLEEFEAIIYDASGNQIDKIRKKDFKDVSAVSSISLYEDSRIKYFEYIPLSYPYTIDFSYSYQTSNTAFIPKWTPVDDYLVGVEKSAYRFEYPEGTNVRKLEKNFDGYAISNKSSGNVLIYEAIDIPVLKKEMISPSFNETQPQLLLALDEFHLEGIDGEASDWKSFGKWRYDRMLANKDVLSSATVAKIEGLLQGITDPVKKAKIVYKYVQDNTRYISVQLGIGGWMPIAAEEVDRVKYGDCKGLTNYTRALLKSQGIESYYTVVWAGDEKRNIEKDFASMQGNHIILNLPNDGDDIWLECTSQKIPFGFLGDFTDDRDVLVITPEGGTIKHTSAYLDSDNKKVTQADIIISGQGGLSADVNISTQGMQYDKRSSLTMLTDEERDKYYKQYWSNINGLKINKIKLENDKDAIAYAENVRLEAQSYASWVADDMLIQLNPFDANTFVPDRYRKRKQDFEVSRGYLDENTYKITLPESYKVDVLPEPKIIDTKFGTYSMQVEKQGSNGLQYTRKLLIRRGRYSKEEYNAYRDFRRTISKTDNLKIILSKKII
ncbi:DUF3857 domain-containing protein [uncultured Kriegella sp.]|uniref:DUF3857 domain-containing protein n=1 Tax=uncultured Kriegella sp. TaxID=1798910 RepID=UPI0030DC2213|tara:strand:- start:138324 stop:140231 length:1908 start_codon:yes stop_codon:yes gene_type:complete